MDHEHKPWVDNHPPTADEREVREYPLDLTAVRQKLGAQQGKKYWRTLDELGDLQTNYLLEEFVPGDIFHVDSIVSEGKVVFAVAHQYGRPPMQVMHEGGVFTTRTVDRTSREWKDLTELNARLAPDLGMARGAGRV